MVISLWGKSYQTFLDMRVSQGVMCATFFVSVGRLLARTTSVIYCMIPMPCVSLVIVFVLIVFLQIPPSSEFLQVPPSFSKFHRVTPRSFEFCRVLPHLRHMSYIRQRTSSVNHHTCVENKILFKMPLLPWAPGNSRWWRIWPTGFLPVNCWTWRNNRIVVRATIAVPVVITI